MADNRGLTKLSPAREDEHSPFLHELTFSMECVYTDHHKGPEVAMNRCILVGVDAHLSPSTWSALESACQLIEQDSSKCRLILLHVIPVPYDPKPRLGRVHGSLSAFPPTQSQLREARQVLWRTRALIRRFGIPPESKELLVRAGIPAEELARVARERDVDLRVLGIRPHSHLSLLRHLLFGRTSRRAAHLAPCRVLFVRPPHSFGSGDLVAWYEQALLRSLQQADSLMVLKPDDVARHFTPGVHSVGRREVDAAACALQKLASRACCCAR